VIGVGPPPDRPGPTPLEACDDRAEAFDRVMQDRGFRTTRPWSSPQDYRMTMLPYGEWVTADGRAVLFNRRYLPLWQKRPGGAVERADPSEWVTFKGERWFYRDAMPEAAKQRAGADALRAWGVPVPAPREYTAWVRTIKERRRAEGRAR
jgi:hypothetical protein